MFRLSYCEAHRRIKSSRLGLPQEKFARSCPEDKASTRHFGLGLLAMMPLEPLGGLLQRRVGLGVGVQQREKNIAVPVRQNPYLMLLDNPLRLLDEGCSREISHALAGKAGGLVDEALLLPVQPE